MFLEFCKSDEISDSFIRGINKLAAVGFGQNEASMLEDTARHMYAADEIQYQRDGEEFVAFAMYRRHLWRASH